VLELPPELFEPAAPALPPALFAPPVLELPPAAEDPPVLDPASPAFVLAGSLLQAAAAATHTVVANPVRRAREEQERRDEAMSVRMAASYREPQSEGYHYR
jgi:hypothetical protein